MYFERSSAFDCAIKDFILLTLYSRGTFVQTVLSGTYVYRLFFQRHCVDELLQRLRRKVKKLSRMKRELLEEKKDSTDQERAAENEQEQGETLIFFAVSLQTLPRLYP